MGIAFDSMIAAHAMNEELPVSLASLSGMKLGVMNWGKGNHDFGESASPPSALFGESGMGRYCGLDAAYTHLLYEQQRVDLSANQPLAALLKHLVFPGLHSLVRMEMNGIWCDMDRVRRRREQRQHQKDRLEGQVKAFIHEDFRETADLGNEHFLRRWIFGREPDGLGLEPISFTERNIPQVDEATLKALRHPALELLRRHRKCSKAISFYDQWESFADDNWRMHPSFNPTGTVTGRRSCDEPNLQQVPREYALRTCIGAPPGWRFLQVDYSTVEVRIAAWFAQEERMLAIFADDSQDIYRYTASLIYGIPETEVTKPFRQKAKAVVLGFLYGMSANGFLIYARDTFDMVFTKEEATSFRETFFSAYPRLQVWHEMCRRQAKSKLVMRSPFGRERHLWGILSTDRSVKAKAERQSINSPVQGTGGDFTLASMVTLYPEMDPEEIMLVGDVHDALLFQVREDVWEKWTYRVLQVMEKPAALDAFNVHVPTRLKAEASVGRYWGRGLPLLLKDFDGAGKVSPDWKGWSDFLADEPEDVDLDDEDALIQEE